MPTQATVSYEKQAEFLSETLYKLSEIVNQLETGDMDYDYADDRPVGVPIPFAILEDIRIISGVLPDDALTEESFQRVKNLVALRLDKAAGWSEDEA